MTSEELKYKLIQGFNEVSQIFRDELDCTSPDLESRKVFAQKWANKINSPISLIPCTPRYGNDAGKFWGYNVSVSNHFSTGTIVVNPE